MLRFVETAERIASTTKKLQKTALLAEYFKSVAVTEAAVAAVFFSGRPFPVWEETTLQVGGTQLWRLVLELSGKSEVELTAAYREHGDLGAVAGAVLPMEEPPRSSPSSAKRADHEAWFSPGGVQGTFREIAAARGPAAKGVLVRELLASISPLEAKYIVKIMTGDLRIGLKESLVEEAIARAFAESGAKLNDVQRANMLLGDIGETLRLAAEGRLSQAKMRLFHPMGFMLASPAESAEDALSYFQNPWVEDKYDGIRAQAHCSGDSVRFFSRTRDEISESFPELPGALAGLPQDAILDGEILAWSYLTEDAAADQPQSPDSLVGRPAPAPTHGRALPFSALQQRLGRKKVSERLMRIIPVAYLVFDVLYAGGELVLDLPLRERAKILDDLLARRQTSNHKETKTERERIMSDRQERFDFPLNADDRRPTADNTLSVTYEERRPPLILRAPVYTASAPEALNRLFDAAQGRGNEGLMIKDPESPYTPGRRGKSWLKLKRELATLDVVVTAVEYGHGRRIGVLSDYTFAVRDGDRLVSIGKAYSGLTDAEILEMTKWFFDHTIEDQGFRRMVEPRIVLEVAFNNIMKSDRHASGYALRFPRIVRLRPDKLPQDADTLERAQEIYERQK
jgi:DNA ligase 1